LQIDYCIFILKDYYNHGTEPGAFFSRDSAGHEVDLVIDCGKQRIAVEIKSGETFASDFRKTLDYWRRLPGQSGSLVAVVYGGNASFLRSNMAVYSWNHWG
jgi:uncharacterized protein